MRVVGLVLAAVPLALALLTGLGAHQRGQGVVLAVLAGLAFPVTWAIWYLRDEQPFRHDTVGADRDRQHWHRPRPAPPDHPRR